MRYQPILMEKLEKEKKEQPRQETGSIVTNVVQKIAGAGIIILAFIGTTTLANPTARVIIGNFFGF